MRYHLNIRDATGLIIDDGGTDFPNLRAARVEARACAAELLFDDLRGGGPIRNQRLEIGDDNGAMVASVGFSVLFHDDCEPRDPSAATGHRGGARKRVNLVTQS